MLVPQVLQDLLLCLHEMSDFHIFTTYSVGAGWLACHHHIQI